VTALLVGGLIGIVATVATKVIGGAVGVLVGATIAVVLLWASFALLIRYALPRRCRALIAGMVVDPGIGAPPNARPIALDVAQRWAEALTKRDWASARAVLADRCVVRALDTEQRGGRRYTWAVRQLAIAYPDLCVHVDAVLADAAIPDVAWVRFTESGHPRRGPALDATWWERWSMDPAHQRVCAIELVGVTRLD
jgi:hypothetical protein